MAIRRSSRAEVQELIGELQTHAGDETRREAVLARLTVIGARAVGHLLEALSRAQESAERLALWQALERVPDPRSIQPILAALGPSSSPADLPLRIAALRAAKPLVKAATGQTSLLERLTVVTLDPNEPPEVRRTALDALSVLPARTLAPIRRRLAEDPDEAMRALTPGRDMPVPAMRPAVADGDPDSMLSEIRREGQALPLPRLHAHLTAARARETDGGRRAGDWTAVRGALHLALAHRESRVALYDLREALEAVDSHPLPVDFAVAARLVGDGSCLEPLARAWLHASTAAPRRQPAGARAADDWQAEWRARIGEAFRAVLVRERPASRKRVLDRIGRRWERAGQRARLEDLLRG